MSVRVDAYDAIRRDALLGVERRRLAPDREVAEVRSEIERAVDDYQRRARVGDHVPLGDPHAMVARILRSITELGPLSELLARADVEEIFVEGARVTYLDGAGRLRGLTEPTTEDENRQLLDRLLVATERQLNANHPLVQARVLDGTARLTAAIPPVTDRLSATVRRYTVRDVGLRALVARDTLPAGAAAFLWSMMQLRSRIVVSGEPGAGKTTLAAALLAAVPAGYCVRSCEEIRELAVPLLHGGYYEVRPPGLDGTGEITLRDLVKFVLAMRPDHIVVGEVRGAEAFELTRAINAGCGFLCTVHANSAPDALPALVNAAMMAAENVTERIVRKIFRAAIDVVIHLERDHAGRRRVCEITALAGSDGFEPMFRRAAFDAPLEWTGALTRDLERRIDRALPDDVSVRGLIDAGRLP